ncbi:hypothetical protein ACA910_015773 [Epithemia clementina (nom. ined.)]
MTSLRDHPEDVKAKEKAARALATAAMAGGPSRSPGALSMDARSSNAALLDERIAAKLNGEGGGGGDATTAIPETPSSHQEHDVMARTKQQEQERHGEGGGSPSQPGAISMSRRTRPKGVSMGDNHGDEGEDFSDEYRLNDPVAQKVHQEAREGGVPSLAMASSQWTSASRLESSNSKAATIAAVHSSVVGAFNKNGGSSSAVTSKDGEHHEPSSKRDHQSGNSMPPEQAPLKPQNIMMTAGPDVEYGMSDPAAGSTNEEGLAVAMPVLDVEEDDGYIQSAIEFDPDAKPSSQQRRKRFRLYALVTLVGLVVAGVGSVLGVLLSSHSDSNQSDIPIVPFRETLGIKDRVERIVGSQVLEDPESPYSKALEWITHNDTMQIVPESSNFVQRYIFSYFYYSTSKNGREPWLSCNPPAPNETDDCMFKQLYNIHPNPMYQDVPWKRWLTGLHECEWAGLSCDEKLFVRNLNLLGQGLSGPIPEGLKYIELFQSIAVSWNNFTGTLPDDLMDLKHLVNFEAQLNRLTGTIPEKWWSSSRLARLNLIDNLFTGTIPSSVGKMEDIVGLYLQDNQLHGTLPTEFGLLTSMTFLYLTKNYFSGTIPSEITNMPKLESLWLNKNNLTGSLPEEIGKLSFLSELRLQENANFGGDLPESFYYLEQLSRLDLRYCNFTGPLSATGLGRLLKLNEFRLSYNNFDGALPSEIQLLVNLADVQLDNTDLTGEIPTELCTRRASSGIGIFRMTANCFANEESGQAPELDCDCCTLCCDTNGENCAPPVV